MQRLGVTQGTGFSQYQSSSRCDGKPFYDNVEQESIPTLLPNIVFSVKRLFSEKSIQWVIYIETLSHVNAAELGKIPKQTLFLETYFIISGSCAHFGKCF